jgi:TRAP-type C4-dicarboxylate transport system substrate-binding protein
MKTWSTLGVLAVAATLTSCTGAEGVDKAGGETALITLASIDEVNNNGQSFGPQAFVERLGQLSGGRLKVEVKTEYGGGAADAESNLVKAIGDGELDGGWPSTRAFSGAGIKGFAAVEAPLTITSYAAQKQLVVSPVADALRKRLESTGIVGLGLTVGPLRRPFAVKTPLLRPSDWNGVRFRTYNSPVQEATVRSLGGTPVNLGFGWSDEAREGRLDGVEFDVAQYARNNAPLAAGNVTANVVLWPKIFVLSMNRERFESFTGQQRTWIEQAAKDATKASVDATYDETSLATELCGKGTRFAIAPADQIGALRAKVRPVIERLAADPDDGPILEQVQAVAAANPGVDVPTVPVVCQQSSAPTTEVGPIPAATSALPAGIYRVEIGLADVERAGVTNADGLTGTWTLRVRDGKYELGCRPLDNPGVDCGHAVYDGALEAGDLRGTGHTAYFVYRPDRLSQLTGCQLPVSQSLSGHCFAGQNYRIDWAVEGDRLIFTNYVSSWTNLQFMIEPWQKIG